MTVIIDAEENIVILIIGMIYKIIIYDRVQ